MGVGFFSGRVKFFDVKTREIVKELETGRKDYYMNSMKYDERRGVLVV